MSLYYIQITSRQLTIVIKLIVHIKHGLSFCYYAIDRGNNVGRHKYQWYNDEEPGEELRLCFEEAFLEPRIVEHIEHIAAEVHFQRNKGAVSYPVFEGRVKDILRVQHQEYCQCYP